MPKSKSKSKSKSEKRSKPTAKVQDRESDEKRTAIKKEIKKSKNEMKKYVAKTNLARLKKIDELDKKKKEKTTTKGKTSESSSTRKKSRSKSKESSRNLSSEALKEKGLVTPKKKKEHRQSTPPTVDSTSTTSSMRNSFTKRLNMSNMSPQKKQRRVDTVDKLQAHQVEWTTNEGCARAIRHNEQDLTKEEVKDMSYSAKLHTLLEMYQPKQLMSAYPGICIAKGINVKNIDMNAAFLNSAKARKTISEACNDVVEINSEASSTSDQDR